VIGFSACSKSPRLAGSLFAAFYFVSGIVALTASQVMMSRNNAAKAAATTALVANLSVSGISNGLAQHLYDLTPQQVAQNSGGRRRNRRRREREGQPPPPRRRSPRSVRLWFPCSSSAAR
jgi:hypothetical protein